MSLLLRHQRSNVVLKRHQPKKSVIIGVALHKQIQIRLRQRSFLCRGRLRQGEALHEVTRKHPTNLHIHWSTRSSTKASAKVDTSLLHQVSNLAQNSKDTLLIPDLSRHKPARVRHLRTLFSDIKPWLLFKPMNVEHTIYDFTKSRIIHCTRLAPRIHGIDEVLGESLCIDRRLYVIESARTKNACQSTTEFISAASA
jgi:hypothetical protein